MDAIGTKKIFAENRFRPLWGVQVNDAHIKRPRMIFSRPRTEIPPAVFTRNNQQANAAWFPVPDRNRMFSNDSEKQNELFKNKDSHSTKGPLCLLPCDPPPKSCWAYPPSPQKKSQPRQDETQREREKQIFINKLRVDFKKKLNFTKIRM